MMKTQQNEASDIVHEAAINLIDRHFKLKEFFQDPLNVIRKFVTLEVLQNQNDPQYLMNKALYLATIPHDKMSLTNLADLVYIHETSLTNPNISNSQYTILFKNAFERVIDTLIKANNSLRD